MQLPRNLPSLQWQASKVSLQMQSLMQVCPNTVARDKSLCDSSHEGLQHIPHDKQFTPPMLVTGLEDLHIDDRNDTGATSTSNDDCENGGREPMHPRESVIDREPLRESQMTVPETPSPDMLAAGKGGRRRDFLAGRNAENLSPTKARGRHQKNATAANMFNDQVKNSYSNICSTAEKMFNRIRQGVTCHAAPSSLKSAFLEPLSCKLASQISIDLLACTDEEFMAMFTGRQHLPAKLHKHPMPS